MPLVKNSATVPCCACTGRVTFAMPESDDDRTAFFHTMPYCARFDQTNTPDAVVQYLRDCRKALNSRKN
jgi:hypothetical protein